MENELQNLFDFNRDMKMLRVLEAEAMTDHRFSGVYLDKVSQLLYLMEQRLALWRIDETSFSSMADVYSCLRCFFREGEILREMAGDLAKNKVDSSRFSAMAERSRERRNFLRKRWNEKFPKSGDAGCEFDGHGDFVTLFQVLAVNLDVPEDNLLIGNELKFLCLLRNLLSSKKDFCLNIWQEASTVLLSGHMVDFISFHAGTEEVKNFIFWFSGFAHDQFKLSFFYYAKDAELLCQRLRERLETEGERNDALKSLLHDFSLRL